MASRSFTVFQDATPAEAPKAKVVTSGVMATRSSARLNNMASHSSTSKDAAPVDKENFHPATGQRTASTTSKKRKTNVLAVKPSAPLTIKKVKSTKTMNPVTSTSPKKRKVPSEALKSKLSMKKAAPELPPVNEELNGNGPKAEDDTQASIDSRCYDLTVRPLADVSQAYEVIELAGDAATTPQGKVKFRKDASAEPDLRDFFSSSQTLASLPSTSTACSSFADTVESRKFSTPERKQIYAAFTFSSPSPSSERFRSSSRAGSKSPSEST